MKKNEDVFKEEVPEEELHSKIDVDDHIYVNHTTFFGGRVITILAILLALTALFSTIYGLLSLDKNLDGRNIGVITSKYSLTVIHSSDSYGGTIDSFEKYNSSNKYYSYYFSITNKNSIDLDYSVSIKNKSNSNVDASLINYELLKNSAVVESGNLSNIGNGPIYKTSILNGTSDKYEIRLWSENIDKNASFAFAMEVLT